jgi:uncharacterized protein (TIGR00725 family)
MAVRRRLTVAVLGSARLGLDDPEWELAVSVGRGLADAGCAVMTGGYGGLMSATASGARGGVVIGLPMRGWSALTPDPGCTELRWSDSYPERLAALLSCDAVIALDGGVGTMSELAVVWAAAQTEPDAPRVVVVGARWRTILDALAASLVAGPADFELVAWAADAEQAVALALEPAATPPGARG